MLAAADQLDALAGSQPPDVSLAVDDSAEQLEGSADAPAMYSDAGIEEAAEQLDRSADAVTQQPETARTQIHDPTEL